MKQINTLDFCLAPSLFGVDRKTLLRIIPEASDFSLRKMLMSNLVLMSNRVLMSKLFSSGREFPFQKSTESFKFPYLEHKMQKLCLI